MLRLLDSLVRPFGFASPSTPSPCGVPMTDLPREAELSHFQSLAYASSPFHHSTGVVSFHADCIAAARHQTFLIDDRQPCLRATYQHFGLWTSCPRSLSGLATPRVPFDFWSYGRRHPYYVHGANHYLLIAIHSYPCISETVPVTQARSPLTCIRAFGFATSYPYTTLATAFSTVSYEVPTNWIGFSTSTLSVCSTEAKHTFSERSRYFPRQYSNTTTTTLFKGADDHRLPTVLAKLAWMVPKTMSIMYPSCLEPRIRQRIVGN